MRDGIDLSSLRRLFLKISQPLGPFAFQGSPQWDPIYWFLEQTADFLSWYLTSLFCYLPLHFSLNLQPPSQGCCSQCSHRLSYRWPLFMSSRFSRALSLSGQSSICIKNKWPQGTPETSWIACSVASCPSNIHQGWLKSFVRTRDHDPDGSSDCLKKTCLLPCLYQIVCSRCPCWSPLWSSAWALG